MPAKTRKKATASPTSGDVMSDVEKAALRETIRERKAQAKQAGDRDAGLKDLLAKIAEMPASDRVIAERVHAIVTENAPDLFPSTWYGMPAYKRNGKVVCFFQAADKFKARYATFGFDQEARLDEGSMWPTSYALTKLTAADEKKIAALVKKAVG
jgi:uncharacterized protein YdhG (YjbR/CyaY superfamily)